MKITRHTKKDGSVALKKDGEFIGTVPAPVKPPTPRKGESKMSPPSPSEILSSSLGETDKQITRWQKIKNLRGIDPNCESCIGLGYIVMQVDGSLGHHPCPKCNPNGAHARIEPKNTPSSWEPDITEPSKEDQIQAIRDKHWIQNHSNIKIKLLSCRCEEEISRLK